MFLYKHKSILSLLAAMMHCKMTLLRVPDECHSLGSKAASTVDVQRIRKRERQRGFERKKKLLVVGVNLCV